MTKPPYTRDPNKPWPKADLHRGQMTLAEHQRNCDRNNYRRLSADEARLVGYSDEEIAADLEAR